MKARVITNQTPIGRRSRLADTLPLATPYMIQVFPVYACNFKCNYCVLTLPKMERGYISDKKFLDLELYRKCIEDIRKFPNKLRMLRFAGTGEPLLHPHIDEMVAMAAEAQIAESIDIVTNGSVLVPDLSRRLVDAGVSRIRVSIQGVSQDKYRETTGTFSDLEKIVDNVKYLYSIRRNVQLYVKIIDSTLEAPEDLERFYGLFGDIADILAVEHLLPATPLIDYSRIAGSAAMDRTQNGASVATTNICSQPFYMLQINPDGFAVPCCGMESPVKVAQLAQTPVTEVWQSQTLNTFRQTMLSGHRSKNQVCARCEQFRFAMFPEDVLDDSVERLMDSYCNV